MIRIVGHTPKNKTTKMQFAYRVVVNGFGIPFVQEYISSFDK